MSAARTATARRARRPRPHRSSITELRARLAEAEATLEAIRSGGVDAVVVTGPRGEQARAIEGATHPYNALLDAMSDGAALLVPDGTILFGNRRLREIARAGRGLRGRRFQEFVAPAERPGIAAFLREGVRRTSARAFSLIGREAPGTPVRVSLSAVPLGAYPGVVGVKGRHGTSVLMAIITDLTERKRAEATRLKLMQRLISAEDAERRRFARELHDETGQSLTAILVGLRTIEGQAITRDVQTVARRLRTLAAHTVTNVGRLARGLHPSVLDDIGLAAAVRRYVSDYAGTFDLAVAVRVARSVPQRLPQLAQTTVYRVLQEALTNVARHAQARAVAVALTRAGAVLDLVVRDDGGGFDVAAALRNASGLGLHGMQERVALLGGSLEINSRPGKGTEVHARVPVAGAMPAPAGRAAARRRPAP